MQRVLHRDDRNTVGIGSREIAGLDGGLDLFGRGDRGLGVGLAADDALCAVGRDVDTVRRLRFGNEIEQALVDRRLHPDHRAIVDHGDIAGGGHFSDLSPVGQAQVVGVVLRAAGLERRTSRFNPAATCSSAQAELVNDHASDTSLPVSERSWL